VANRDQSLDALLLLDGESFFADEAGLHWVKFAVKRVPATSERPHGLAYSLTLHDESGVRLLGFDNAHAIREGSGPGARTRVEHDHRHTGKTDHFYAYRDAAALLADFWKQVESILEKRSKQS
jgi:hypothetical protein